MSVSMGALSSIGGTATFLGQLIPPLGDFWSQLTYSVSPIKIPDVGTLVHLKMRGYLTDGDYKTRLRALGFSETFANQFLAGATVLLGAQDAIAAWRRGIISEERLTDELQKQGIEGDTVALMKKLTEFYPTAGDMIRFAVREVYSPEIVHKFGMMEDLPQKFISEARKVGVSEEQARNYWASHWELPSPQMGFEMLHRDIISEAELKLLLKTLDIMPYWRDKLIKLSYNPLTRVDVRRMYRLGVLNEEGLLRAYMNLGYSPDDAKLMVEFTKKYESGEDNGITRGAIQSAYKKGLLTQDEFRSYLAGLDYPDTVIDLWLEITEFEMMEKEIDEAIDDVATRFKLGELDLEGVKIVLDKMGLPADFAEKVVRELKSKVSAKLKMPTEAVLTQWLKLGIIDFVEYGQRMKDVGYRDEDICLYITEAEAGQDTTKRSYLGKQHYQKLLGKEIISVDYFRRTLLQMGTDAEDVEAMILEVQGGETNGN